MGGGVADIPSRPSPDEDHLRPRVLIVSGALREPSFTRVLASAVEDELKVRKAAVRHWNLRDSPLPMADPEYHEAPETNPNATVKLLVEEAEATDCFVLASPVYHNSFSGVLKNALDCLTIRQFRYKAVGLIGHGSNRSAQAVDHLRIVVRGLQGVAIPAQVCTCAADFSIAGTQYELASPDIEARIQRFATELLDLALVLRAIRSRSLEAGQYY